MIDIQGFEAFLIEDELSENTISGYVKTMEMFSEKFDVFSKENALKFKSYYVKNFKPKTVNTRISALEKYSKYIEAPIHLKRVKEHKAACVENVINEEQYSRLKQGLLADKNYRFFIILELMAKTGGRVSEVIRYQKKDLLRGFVDIKTKGKIRRIYFPKNLQNELEPYLRNYSEDDYLCLNRFGRQITTRGISQYLTLSAEKYQIPKEVMHPHSFRHFFAVQFLKRNNNISLLADLLGHSGVNTTMIYTRMSQEQQTAEINKAVNW